MQPLLDVLCKLYASRGYVFFAGATAAFDLNLFGIRQRNGVNLFNDVLGCAFAQTAGAPLTLELWPGTTDPGSFYLRQPGAHGGTAIVVPGQYRGLWKLGLHRGADVAFVQSGDIAVYRDGDRDNVLDFDPKTIVHGVFGINGHHAGVDSKRVNNWSAGCQVWARREDHDRSLELGRAQLAHHPTWTTFTYTLFDVAQDPGAVALLDALTPASPRA